MCIGHDSSRPLQLMTTMTTIGKVEQFKSEEESTTAYLEQVELYFEDNNSTEGEKKATIFLSVICVQPYTLTDSFSDTNQTERENFWPVDGSTEEALWTYSNSNCECLYFHHRSQQPDESITQYIAELQNLATHCQFAGYLDEALRDCFVCGIRNEVIQRRLLMETDLTLPCATKLV